MANNRTGQSRAYLEIAAVVATGLLNILFTALDVQRYFILAAMIGWIAYIAFRVRRRRDVLGEWGFRAEGFGAAFRDAWLFFIPAAVAMAIYAAVNGNLIFPARTLKPLALYPLWGVVQQFLVLALIVRNLERLWAGLSRVALALVGAALFGVVHVPEWRLVVATFAMGLVFVYLYWRHRNLWALGLIHGWLGTLFYLWVLGREPWADVMGR